MPNEPKLEYIVRCDGEPKKSMHLKPSMVPDFWRRLTRQFPDHDWAIIARFVPEGAD